MFLLIKKGAAAANNCRSLLVSQTFIGIKKGLGGFGRQDGSWVCWRGAATTTSTRSGAILPEPKTTPFGFFGVISGVVIGLFIGATISKNVANFLEENDLFVPSDDDDDDD